MSKSPLAKKRSSSVGAAQKNRRAPAVATATVVKESDSETDEPASSASKKRVKSPTQVKASKPSAAAAIAAAAAPKKDASFQYRAGVHVLIFLLFATFAMMFAMDTFPRPRTSPSKTRALPEFNSNLFSRGKNVEAKLGLETFFDSLVLANPGSTLLPRARVLQVETNSANAELQLSQALRTFSSIANVQVMELDAAAVAVAGTRLDLFSKFANDALLVLVIVRNADKAAASFLLSLAGMMENPVLVDRASGRTRNAQTLGFIFLGTSLPRSSMECEQVDLLTHDETELRWPPSFISRLSDQVKVCE